MKMFRQAAMISVIVASFAASRAEARSPWTTTGPPGASITALAAWPADASILFAGTSTSGLYISSDGGTTWQANGSVFANLAISSLSAGVAGSSIVLAGTASGLFGTTDAGATWRDLSNGIPGSEIDSVAIGGSSIYVGASQAFLDGSVGDGEVFASTDGGASFSATGLSHETAGARVVSLAVDASHVLPILYAGVEGAGIFKLAAFGTWTASSLGLPASATVLALSVNPSTPTHLLAGTDVGLYSSLDAGLHWSAAGVGLSASAVNQILRAGGASQTLYAAAGPNGAGLYQSTDGGSHWTPLPTGFGSVAIDSALLLGGSPAILFAGSSGAGLARSTDGGASWSGILPGLPLARVSCLASSPLQPSLLLAGDATGIFASPDGGTTWSASSDGLALAGGVIEPITAIAADPASASTFYAGMSGCSSGSCAGAVFRSSDAGRTWSLAASGPSDGVVSVAVDPIASTTVYAGTRHCGTQLACGGSLWKSTDSGASWEDLDPTAASIRAPVASILLDHRNGLTIDVGTSGRGVLRSTDGGSSWATINSGLAGLLVNQVIADGTTAGLFAATSKGAFHSADGSTWSPAGTGLPIFAVNTMIFAPGSASEVFAGTQGGGLWLSTDKGAHWFPAVSNGLGRQVSSIVFASNNVGLRAGTESGVFRFAPLTVGPVSASSLTTVGGR